MAWLLAKTLPTIANCKTNTCYVFMVVLTGILIAYASQPAINYEISILNDTYAAGLAQTYKERSPKDAKTWNWWGPGYFIQYFADRQTFIDRRLSDGPKDLHRSSSFCLHKSSTLQKLDKILLGPSKWPGYHKQPPRRQGKGDRVPHRGVAPTIPTGHPYGPV